MDAKEQLSSSPEDEETRNWSAGMPLDIMINVVRKVESVEDYFNFRGVCGPWRCAAVHEESTWARRLPSLLQISKNNPSSELEFINPLAGTVLPAGAAAAKLSKKILGCTNCFACGGGWLLVQKKRKLDLFHVVSGARIRLPGQGWTGNGNYIPLYFSPARFPLIINRGALTSDPLTNPSDCTLMIAYNNGSLGSWSPGDKTLTKVVEQNMSYYSKISDIIFHNGMFYTIDETGCIKTYERTWHPFHHSWRWTETDAGYRLPSYLCDENFVYLVKTQEELLLVLRQGGMFENCNRLSDGGEEIRFVVYKVEHLGVMCEEGTRLKDLGGQAIFVGGLNASFTVANATGSIPGCKPNHIYFTGIRHHRHHWGWRTPERYNKGTYSLTADGRGRLVEYSATTSTCLTKSWKLDEDGSCYPPIWIDHWGLE